MIGRWVPITSQLVIGIVATVRLGKNEERGIRMCGIEEDYIEQYPPTCIREGEPEMVNGEWGNV